MFFIGSLKHPENCRGVIKLITTEYTFQHPLDAFDAFIKLIVGGSFYYPHSSSAVFQFAEQLIFKVNCNQVLTTACKTLLKEFKKAADTIDIIDTN